MSPAAASAQTIADFKEHLEQLTSYTATIGKAAVSAGLAKATAQAVAALPDQHQALLAVLRTDFLTSLDGQRTTLEAAASSWAATLETRLQTACTLLEQTSAALQAALHGHATSLRTETQQALKDAQGAVRDQLTTLATMRQQYETALTERDAQLTSSLAAWGVQVAALTQTALESLTVASEAIAATLRDWNTRADEQRTKLAAVGSDLNRILLGLNKFRDELDAARFSARLEALTVGLEQLKTQNQTQHEVTRQSVSTLAGNLDETRTQQARQFEQFQQQVVAQQQATEVMKTELVKALQGQRLWQWLTLAGVVVAAVLSGLRLHG